jgi:hypothetical protein
MEASETTTATPREPEARPRLFGETRRWWGQIGRWQRATVLAVAIAVVVRVAWGVPRLVQWKHEQSYLSRTHIQMPAQERLAVGYRACDWLRGQPDSEFRPGGLRAGGIDAAVETYWHDTGEWWVVNFTARQAWLQLCRDVAVDKFGTDPQYLFGEPRG